MKGKIRKIPDRIFGKEDFYAIEYKNGVEVMFIPLKDMDEFMDDIYSQHLKNKYSQNKHSQQIYGDYPNIHNHRKVITKQEEAEQDRDRREMDGETKTHNNFPTDEALDFDLNVRERV